MKKGSLTKGAMVLATAFLFTAGSAHADLPGSHPHYLHAISDLRAARWYIQNRPGDMAIVQNEQFAIAQIDEALHDLQKASIDDGKNPNYAPPAQVPPDRAGNLHKAVELLEEAHNDVALEEDDPYAVGLQQRSLRHIHDAAESIRHAIWDAEHGR
jgi:hypothetical protein